MHVELLHLRDFRGFEEIDLELRPGCNVLLGRNGAGKSTVLSALATLLKALPCAADPNLHWPPPREALRLNVDDGRVGGGPVNIVAARFRDGDCRITCQLADQGFDDMGRLRELVDRRLRSGSLPVAAHYPTDRVVVASGLEPGQDVREGPAATYDNAFDQGTGFGPFLRWFRDLEDVENEAIRADRAHVDPKLEAVRRALQRLLPGVSNPRFRRRAVGSVPAGLVVDKEGLTLSLGQLSHGERTLLACVGDIARRLAIANPGAADPLAGDGVVLIDEIELHLHPSWQRQILGQLETTFPGLQLVVATHSPQVVSQVGADRIILLEDFRRRAVAPTMGRDANSILWDVMGVERFAPSVRERLRALDALLDAEEWQRARQAISRLAEDFGELDPEVVRLRVLLDTLAA